MKILKSISEVRRVVKNNKDKQIGFVPTMGFLHEGHLSLIKKAREENELVFVSIFVNPTQFGENEDLDSYPRDLERDSNLCLNAEVSLVLCLSTKGNIELKQLSTVHKKPVNTKTLVEYKGMPPHSGCVTDRYLVC